MWRAWVGALRDLGGFWAKSSKRQEVRESELWAAAMRACIRQFAGVMRPAGAPDATGGDEIEGDNRRKKFWRTLATRVAGVCWGGSRFGWFLVKNGKVKQDRCMPECAWQISGKFVCKSLKNESER
ncbi:hypothetical protein B7486_09700 [cyanobacterium TDX16]|nr:hypothetical protein B7486_09700 [cyanobacterium TDX16]